MYVVMLSLVRIENLMYVVYIANARKNGNLNVHSADLVISVGSVSVLRQRLFVPGLFVPNMLNARHLMFYPIIPDVSSYMFIQAALY